MFVKNSRHAALLFIFVSVVTQTAIAFAQNFEPQTEQSILESTPAIEVESSVVVPAPVESSVLNSPPHVIENSVLQGVVETPGATPSIASAMLAVHNEMRVRFGRPPQQLSHPLTQLAQQHATQMAATGTLYHVRLGGSVVRENIAMGHNDVEAVFSLWRSKAGHFRNLMGAETAVGFGFAVGQNGSPYWVAIFGSENPTNGHSHIAPVVYEAPVTRTVPSQPLIRGLIPEPLKQFSSGGILRRMGTRFSR